MASSEKRVLANNHPVDSSDLKTLFSFSDYVARLSPWEYLYESQVFGVRPNGAEGDTYWVNVIGGAGEVFAVNIYRGLRGLHGLAVLIGAMDAAEDGEDYDSVAVGMEQCMFQIEFVTKVDLDVWDRKAIKKARRSLPTKRGALSPRFLSFVPGYLPWRLEADEGKELAELCREVMTVLSFLEEEPEMCPEFPSEEIPVFVFGDEEGVDIRLEDTRSVIEALDDGANPLIELDDFSKEKYRSLPQNEEVEWELATSIGPAIIDDKKSRPYFPYVCVICEREYGRVLVTELYPKERQASHIVSVLIQALDTLRERPKVVFVEERGLFELVQEWLTPLGIRVEKRPCDFCHEAFDAMYEAMG